MGQSSRPRQLDAPPYETRQEQSVRQLSGAREAPDEHLVHNPNQRRDEAAPRQLRGAPAPQYGHTTYNLDQLAMILCADFEATCHVSDLYETLRQHNAFSDKALAAAAYLGETPKFSQWLLDIGSNQILVNGHCAHETSRRTSPLSVFCASLIQNLLGGEAQGPGGSHDEDLVLHFFCGQHVDPHGPLAGPQGLIRSLTTQLILAWPQKGPPPDLRFLSSLLPGTVSSAEEDLDVEIVCGVFYELLRQLPARATVYCIVDGISYFETVLEGWSQQICYVVDCFWACCDGGRHGGPRATVKILLASTDKSIVVCDSFSTDQVVDMRAGNLCSSPMSPRALRLSFQSQASSSDGRDL